MTIIKTFDTDESSQKKIFGKYLYLVVISFFVLILIEIWINHTVIAYGEKYEKLSALEKNLTMENQILENEIAKSSSLGTVATKSAELGFSTTYSIQYIR